MKVTPTKKKFGKYAPGHVFDFPDKIAKVFIRAGKLREADKEASPPPVRAAQLYATRMMQAESFISQVSAPKEPAPYGYKADGTPRKRPGRPVSE